MPRSALLLGGAGAALLCAATTLAHAGEAPEGQTRPSRISPFPPDIARPPSPMAVPPPPGRALDAPREEPATIAGFIDATRMCMNVVSPQFEVRAGLLPTSGWSWFQPRQVPMGNRTFEMVQYSKGGISLALLDDGSLVVCRVLGEFEGAAQLSQVRATLLETLGAVPIESVPRLAPLVERLRRGAPQTVLANFLVAGDYTLEVTLHERALPASATSPARTLQSVMVESLPLPAPFRAPARTGAR